MSGLLRRKLKYDILFFFFTWHCMYAGFHQETFLIMYSTLFFFFFLVPSLFTSNSNIALFYLLSSRPFLLAISPLSLPCSLTPALKHQGIIQILCFFECVNYLSTSWGESNGRARPTRPHIFRLRASLPGKMGRAIAAPASSIKAISRSAGGERGHGLYPHQLPKGCRRNVPHHIRLEARKRGVRCAILQSLFTWGTYGRCFACRYDLWLDWRTTD